MEFPFLNKAKPKSGLCCIYLLPDSLILAYVAPQADLPPRLEFIETRSYTDRESLSLLLENLVEQYQLQDTPCSWVLTPENYQLVLIEKPGVEASEMMQAIRWQVKKIVNAAVGEVVVNYIDLPLFYKKEEKSEIYVSVAKSQPMQAMADVIFNSGFNLKFIDITELALRNLNALYGDEESYVGLLLLKSSGSVLIITHKKELLLTRSIPLSLELTEEVALEIQRSFVFCQNQQQEAMPKKLLIAPEDPNLASYLSSQLEIEVEVLPMKKMLQNDNGALDNLSHDQIIAVGGALRSEEKPYATN